MKPRDHNPIGLLGMNGLLLRSTLVVIFVSLLASLVAVFYTAHVTHQRAYEHSQRRLNELLNTVESTLQVACFAKDQTLAGELAQGLLNNSDLLAVTITSENQILADKHRQAADAANNGPPALALNRLIYSPFDNQKQVGHIVLKPDLRVIEVRIQDEVRFAAIQLSWQLAMVVFAVAAVMLLFIVRPIKAMSDRLHSMDPTTGDRLPIPRRHSRSEIGQLVNDINALADRLVNTLAAEHHLRLAREIDERKYHAIFDNAESGIFILDDTGSLLSWNAAFGRLFEISETGPENEFAWIKISLMAWDNPDQIASLSQSALRQTGSVNDDLLIYLANGKRRWVNIALSPVGENLLQGIVHDVTPHKDAEASARQLVVTDPLTGLANRLGLEACLRSQIQEYALTQSGDFTLLLLNLDEFRSVNEGMGLPAGDSILQTTANRLLSCIKNGDSIARLSADSFGIILKQMTLTDVVEKICNRILEAVRLTHFVDGSPINLHASIGITRFPLDAGDVPNLLRQAELALDNAKASGGNTHVFFDPVLAETAEHQRQLQNDLRAAIQNHELVMFYQPIIDLRTQRLTGAEALLRWWHPTRGMVMPDSFIPMAEKSGLIIDIGLFALDAACRQLRDWQDQGLDYTLSLNVSGRQIPDGLSPAKLHEVITHYGISTSRLALEITEGVMLQDIQKSLHWLNEVHAMGLRIYLDDFGTGFSSLSYLKQFPIDTLKVDKSFVQDMQPDNNEHTLVGAIIAMGRSLGLQIVAEGVELPSHLAALSEMGCHFAQGYYFSRPVPAEEFPATADEIAVLLTKTAARGLQ